MKIKIITAALLLVTITGCQKQPEHVQQSPSRIAAKAAFEQSDQRIGVFLDQLDDPKTDHSTQVKILCESFPSEYHKHYIPALLELQPKDYTEAKLLADLKSALDYYKNRSEIKC